MNTGEGTHDHHLPVLDVKLWERDDLERSGDEALVDELLEPRQPAFVLRAPDGDTAAEEGEGRLLALRVGCVERETLNTRQKAF
jgi:hypothetical protein